MTNRNLDGARAFMPAWLRLSVIFLSAFALAFGAVKLARANGGRAEARKRGVRFGPKPKLARHQEQEVARMVHMQGLSLRAVAHHYHVGHSTIVRALERVGSQPSE